MRRSAALLVLLAGLLGCTPVRSFIYPAPSTPIPETPPAPFEEVWIESARGDRVHAWHAEGGSAERPAMVFFHGNGENLGTMALTGTLEVALPLVGALLVPDYPGYGRSPGRPSEAALMASAEAAVEWLVRRHPERPVVVAGWSLGAAVALPHTSGERVAGLIALSPWTSLDEVARVHFGGWLVGLLLRERYDSLQAAPGVEVPVLMVHGARDRIIPSEQARRLAEALSGDVHRVELPGVGHNDLLGHRLVWSEIETFLDRLTS